MGETFQSPYDSLQEVVERQEVCYDTTNIQHDGASEKDLRR
jgi:hypothetical protein